MINYLINIFIQRYKIEEISSFYDACKVDVMVSRVINALRLIAI